MTTYLVAVSLVVASIQIYLLWRLLHAFDVLRRFEERLGHFGDALSLLTETTETGFDSLGRELERLRALGEVRAELRGGVAGKPAPAPARLTVAEVMAEALMARADATPAHVLAPRESERRREEPRSETSTQPQAASGPSVAFLQVAGVASSGATTTTRDAVAADGSRAPAGSAALQHPPTGDIDAEAAGLDLVVAQSDPVSDVVRLIESAQGRPTPAQLNEAAIRLRMHLAGGTARARQSARTPAGTLRAREERHHGALRS